MYNEIIRLVEAGVAMDRRKVLGYARLLADDLEKKGDQRLADRIRSVIANNKRRMIWF